MDNRNLQADNKIYTKIRIGRIKEQIRKVLVNTKRQNIQMGIAIDNQRLQLQERKKKLKDNSQNAIVQIQVEQSDSAITQKYEQMITKCQTQSELIKNEYNSVQLILKDFQKNGLSQFDVLQQQQQLDFVEVKKTVCQVNSLYEYGILRLDKLNQIYLSYYNLSMQKCGVCLNQPEINKVILLECGHSICEDCLNDMFNGKRYMNRLNRCPFCRQQIEILCES